VNCPWTVERPWRSNSGFFSFQSADLRWMTRWIHRSGRLPGWCRASSPSIRSALGLHQGCVSDVSRGCCHCRVAIPDGCHTCLRQPSPEMSQKETFVLQYGPKLRSNACPNSMLRRGGGKIVLRTMRPKNQARVRDGVAQDLLEPGPGDFHIPMDPRWKHPNPSCIPSLHLRQVEEKGHGD
jgi:hypothetical protein